MVKSRGGVGYEWIGMSVDPLGASYEGFSFGARNGLGGGKVGTWGFLSMDDWRTRQADGLLCGICRCLLTEWVSACPLDSFFVL